jgi:hypothetical protein
MVSRRLPPTPLVAVIMTLTMAAACTSSGGGSNGPDRNGTDKPCVVAAAGDVAGQNDYRTGAARTAELISSAAPRKVLALGDLAYKEGSVAEFADYYDPTWGSLKSITAPTPGNHEYASDGKGYLDYFGVAHNYAIDLCGWHIVSVDQYANMSKAVAFIEDEGRSAGKAPLLVFWHEPRFSSGTEHGSNPKLQPLWEAAVAAGAEIVLNGHDHNYERFEPLDARGEPGSGGTVEFVSGNGGHDLRGIGDRKAHSAAVLAGTPGILFLTLRADSYDWSYRDIENRIGDTGTRRLR